VKELNEHILPPGVKVVPFLDRKRSGALHHPHRLHNLTEGNRSGGDYPVNLFLGKPARGLIVALTIPFSLLFASILSRLRHIPPYLLSLGALDFRHSGDGAV